MATGKVIQKKLLLLLRDTLSKKRNLTAISAVAVGVFLLLRASKAPTGALVRREKRALVDRDFLKYL